MTQYIFTIGASDITDVIDNTLGAVIGILLYLGMKNLEREDGKIITILGAVLEVLFLALLFLRLRRIGCFKIGIQERIVYNRERTNSESRCDGWKK